MLNSIYPDELRASAPPPDPDRKRVIRWFMQVGRIGEGAAGNKAAFYTLLASGELQKAVTTPKANGNTAAKSKAATSPRSERQEVKGKSESDSASLRTRVEPNIQLNVQIHINADATKDQIDAIFASMATHLRR
jgi:hypothetical protein